MSVSDLSLICHLVYEKNHLVKTIKKFDEYSVENNKENFDIKEELFKKQARKYYLKF